MQDGVMLLGEEGIHRRAGGRRRYNAQRRRSQTERRAIVAERLLSTAGCPANPEHGWRAQLARDLRVSLGTISRDVQAVRAEVTIPAPCCRLHGDQAALKTAQLRDQKRLERESLTRSLGAILGPAAIERILRDGP